MRKGVRGLRNRSMKTPFLTYFKFKICKFPQPNTIIFAIKNTYLTDCTWNSGLIYYFSGSRDKTLKIGTVPNFPGRMVTVTLTS